MEALFGLLFIIMIILGVTLIAAPYLFPTIVAHKRGHHAKWGVTILNVTLGWSILGWVISSIWAFSIPSPDR